MVMNLTIDDTFGVLSYSSGWRVQPRSDPNFFQGTYHASQSSGQTASLTFNGSAIYIYGSKGITYGGFEVQLDQVVTFNSSALPASSNPAAEYQQLLYANTFSEGAHVFALSTNSDGWVDIDFIVLTTIGPEANPDPGSFTSTESALEPSGTSSQAVPRSSSQTGSSLPTSSLGPAIPSSSPAASDSSASSSNNVTVALTGVFGALLFIVILCFFLHHLLKGYRRRQYEREREFRRGTQPYGKSKSNIAPATEKPYGGGGVFRGLLGGSGSPPSSGGGSVSGAPSGERSGTPLSNASVGILRPPRASGNSPLGTAGAYATTKGGPMRQSPPVDPRQSIDFLSVRS